MNPDETTETYEQSPASDDLYYFVNQLVGVTSTEQARHRLAQIHALSGAMIETIDRARQIKRNML